MVSINRTRTGGSVDFYALAALARALDWAMTQNNLGTALRTLGARESGTARLEEAVAAFEVCLTIIETAWSKEWVQVVRSDCDETRVEIARRRATT